MLTIFIAEVETFKLFVLSKAQKYSILKKANDLYIWEAEFIECLVFLAQ